jgi:glycoprotein endo-alpha-1,2-mannosidase
MNIELMSISNLFRALVVAALIASVSMDSCDSDGAPDIVDDGPKKVEKTNSAAIYMHYMPWFQSKEISGFWGSHWRMNTANPDIIEDGQRQIASHYYPLIGPYDSKDPDVIEYHLLLMKYVGVDGVLLDWYSSFNVNDYKSILDASNVIVAKTAEVGVEFAIVYEDYTAESVEEQTSKTAIEAAKADLAYMQQNYFSKVQYIKFDGNPLLMTFGPRYFKQGTQWTEIFSGLPAKPKFLPLWNHGALVGDNDNGEYSWIDFNADLSDLHAFYGRTSLEILIGSAFARFDDYYVEGGWGTSYGNVPYNTGQTLQNTFAKATERNIDKLQLVTWNDFGEGTMLEPTVEDQFTSLTIIQEFTGVPYSKDELELIHSYYLKKKKYKGDPSASEKLKEVYGFLVALEVDKATQLLNELD